ncbi:MAG: LysR family transcriptional regulator [Rhodobacteraceae bacterium]|nr:LysR family transcriptional regulator [Paracoccaceae bacterium]TVR48076.1 MAG: LysR family transcriptional regulator [Paracoccaceae bacterium]
MLDRLEMFITLADARHFGRAAERLGITQPSLSAALKQLEGELGVQLVFRGARYQGLTPEGARVLDWATRIVGDARTLREEMRAARHGLSGNLRLGVVPTALPMIAGLTGPYLRAHPNVRIEILSRSSIEILEQIDKLQLDAGVSYLDNEPLGRVVTEPLYTESYLLLTRPDHPLAARKALGWGELGDLPLCLLTGDMQNRRIINAELAAMQITTSPQMESNSVMALVAHVQAGPWVSIVNAHTADLFAGAPGLAAVPIRGEGGAKQVGLIAPWREPHTPVLAGLLAEARRFRRD